MDTLVGRGAGIEGVEEDALREVLGMERQAQGIIQDAEAEAQRIVASAKQRAAEIKRAVESETAEAEPAALERAYAEIEREWKAGDRIDISEFAKVELRAAKITAAEKVEGSKKLIKLQVDLGGESRQVVAGIADSYAPEALVGKTVVLVANLKPAKLMGVESNGMVLAGSIDGKAVLCSFDAEVAPGTKVK